MDRVEAVKRVWRRARTGDDGEDVGLEPWVVLLRSQDARTRCVVVVEAQGDILGCMKTPMNEWESLYFDPTAE